MVTIYVEDLSPKFTQDPYTGSLNETADAGTPVVTVSFWVKGHLGVNCMILNNLISENWS